MQVEARSLRWGGVAALAAVASLALGMAVLLVPLRGESYRFRDAAGTLGFLAEHQVLMAQFLWLGVLGFALLMVAVLGLRTLLASARLPTAVAAGATVLGLVLWVLWCVWWLGMTYGLAPAYAELDAGQPAVEAVAAGLISAGHVLYAVAALLTFAGVALLSLAGLEVQALGRWWAWAGLATAVLAGLGGAFGQWLPPAFPVELAGWAGFVVWLVAAARRMLRGPGPALSRVD